MKIHRTPGILYSLPSGFSELAADGVTKGFLRVTGGDLDQEISAGKHASRRAGCAYEIGQIKSDLPTRTDLSQQGVLLLTLDFYQGCAAIPGDHDLTDAEVQTVLDEIKGKILAIDIPDKVLSQRT